MLSVIIPCYNEEENIKLYKKELIPEIRKCSKDFEIIFVNDGSKDKTLGGLKQLQKEEKNIKVVAYEPNQGMGYALRQGINAARGDLTVFLDADLTFHPSQIPELLKRFTQGDVDCVIGSHFMSGGELGKDIPFYRIFLSKGVNILYTILMGKSIRSMSSIFRLYRTKDLKEMRLTSTAFDINAEILFKLLQKKKKVIEIPATLTTRRFGVSKLNTRKEIINHLKLLTKILFWKLKKS